MASDVAESKAFEQQVAQHLGPFFIDRTDSTTELDWWIPGAVLDAKEKKQPCSKVWHLLPDVPEENLFILDELSIRKAAKHYPTAYFLVHDRPQGRLFIVSITQIICQERARVNRVGKGKAIFDMSKWTELDSLNEIVGHIMADLITEPWKRSECVGPGVRQVA